MKATWLGPALVFTLTMQGMAAAQPGAIASVAPPVPTFAHDIAPILLTSCAPCHHDGGSAPFPLVTYTDVRGRARQIVDAVSRRAMPPWKPEPGFGSFLGERRLQDAQIALFQQWLTNGAQVGRLVEAPDAPRWTDGWALGPPDLVVTLPSPYRLGPNGGDRLRQFVLPVPTSEAHYVKAWQFRTSRPQVVHHATLMLDSTRASRRLDDADPQPGYEGLVPLSARNPDGYFLGWTPGQTPYAQPDHMGWRLDAGDDLVAMLHLMPTGREEDVDISIGFYFADAPPELRPVMIRLNQQNIDIPAGESSYTVADDYTLPVDVDVYGVQPHAHNLAREVKATATLPDGTERPLVYIKDWDFHWQDAYRLVKPLHLPAGTTLSMAFRYDNSERNPHNPFRPPRHVAYGQRTSEEMGDVWIQVVPRRAADGPLLARSLSTKILPQNISGYQMMLRADPDNVTLHDDLAMLFVEAGDLRRAADQFAESLRLNPTPAASYNVANARLGLGRFAEAETRFRKLLEVAPGYGLARQGLALALAAQGRDRDAERAFEAAVHLTPSAEAFYQFGAFRERQGQLAPALGYYADALRLRPDWPAAQLARAWLLATADDPQLRNADEALRLARLAARTAEDRLRASDVLAAALASTGQFARAESTVREALAQAGADANADAIRGLTDRLRLYALGRTYVNAEPTR